MKLEPCDVVNVTQKFCYEDTTYIVERIIESVSKDGKYEFLDTNSQDLDPNIIDIIKVDYVRSISKEDMYGAKMKFELGDAI
jgi:hypothetical protein